MLMEIVNVIVNVFLGKLFIFNVKMNCISNHLTYIHSSTYLSLEILITFHYKN